MAGIGSEFLKDSSWYRAGETGVKLQMVPVPVPVFIPVPMNMYSQYTPVVVTMPLPVPVPLVVPPQKKEMKDAAVQWEPAMEEQEELPCAVQSSSHYRDSTSELVAPSRCEETRIPKAEPPFAESADLPSPSLAQAQTSPTSSRLPPSRAADELPPSPVMDLESDFPTESLDQKSSATKRGVKRPREGSTGRKKGRRRTGSLDRGAGLTSPESGLNHMYGVNAWRSWVRQRSEQPPDLEVKEDVLLLTSAELSRALSLFIKEVCRPNGDSYSADSIFYLCLGIQQYLFLKGRIENIFTDELYSQFASDITGMLRQWKPKLLPSGGAAVSRVEESFLWECKQLGAYSPIVLLNTLLFFCTKNFHLSTVEQHQSMSFSTLVWCSRASSRGGTVHYLQHQRGGDATPRPDDTEHLRTKQAKNNLEMVENISNPLHCPVRLYEFYLSRCPESAKQRGNLFYLQPEQNVHTHSLHWYTAQPLDTSTLQSMLTRILAVREVQQGQEAAARQPAGSEEL